MTKEMTEEQRVNYTLKLTATTGAEANGQDTNTINVSLLQGTTFVSKKAVALAVTAGSAVFVTNDSQEVTLTTDAFGSIAAKITDIAQETVTVTATLVDNTMVTAKVTTKFGEGGDPGTGDGLLKVMGARTQWAGHAGNYGGTVHTLTALDTKTLQPQVATWQYAGESETVMGERFQDIHPDRVLTVSTTRDRVQLNTSNINGNTYAMLARCNPGYVVAWGKSDYGGDMPNDIAALSDIAITATSGSACAALRANGHVVAWGLPNTGGSLPSSIARYDDITALASTTDAFAALRANGSVVAWGAVGYGGIVPGDIARLSDITHIIGGGFAFAALRANGSVVAWGDSNYGGTVPDEIARLTDIVAVTAGLFGFVALRANGQVVAWEHWYTIPADIAAYNDVVEVVGGYSVFLVRRANGSVNAWGNEDYGGRVPAAVLALTDVVGVAASSRALAVLRANGQVMAWGNPDFGGEVPTSIAQMNSIVQVVGNGNSYFGGAFCALCRDGSVVSWGGESYGGFISAAVANRLWDVRAVYSGGCAFAALTGDDRVVTWGNGDEGGDSSSVQAELDGHISYELKS